MGGINRFGSGGIRRFQLISVPPIITSPATFDVLEGTTAVGTVTATDGETPYVFSISGGADAALFDIDPDTGVLVFLVAPDYASPDDSGANNVYDITVRATSSGGAYAEQDVAITVTEWLPSQLGSALKWWMDAGYGIYTDAGTTPAVNDGDLVYRWVCRASGMVFDQSNSGNRPTLRIGANGKPAVEFANGKYLICSSHSLPTGNSARSFSLGTKWAGVPWENNFPFAYGTPGTNFTYAASVVSGNWAIVAFSNDWSSTGLAASTSAYQVVDSKYDGTNLDMRLDGGTPATTTPTAYNTQAGAAYLGLFTTTGERYAGRVTQLVLTNTALSNGDRASLLTFQQRRLLT